jgi:hypothetical protein
MPASLDVAADEAQHLRARIELLDHRVADVGPVEARDEKARLVQREPVHDLGAGMRIRGGGQRDARHAREALVQHRKLQVFRPEVVAPLRHAVRLVDREERELRPGGELEHPRHVSRSGDVQQNEFSASRSLSTRRLRAPAASNSGTPRARRAAAAPPPGPASAR